MDIHAAAFLFIFNNLHSITANYGNIVELSPDPILFRKDPACCRDKSLLSL